MASRDVLLSQQMIPAIKRSHMDFFETQCIYTTIGKKWRFSTEIAVFLRNGARWADDYYRTLIGSRGYWIEWYHFR